MKEEAGNEYQNKSITIDVTVLATQLASEEDSFDNQYDKDAEFDKPVKVTNEAELKAAIAEASTDAANPTVISIANSFEVSERVTIPAGKNVVINGNGKTISRAADSTANPVIRIEENANITDLTVDAKADATNVSRAVYVTADADAVLTNCKITGAYNTGYGGAMQVYGNVTLEN
ncbi:MAG: ABC transporter permease [Clostridiales bacterium]|nr:ABC transporter permease [Clostridiales bacterium]